MTNIQPIARSKNGTPLFPCACPDCGVIRNQDKRKIGTLCRSCATKRRATHGMSGSRIYRVWAGMVARCTNPSATHYKYYGGRGIDVCREWRESSDVFFAWAHANGYADGMEMDRIDSDGDYSPGNCRFISHQENSQLRRNARCTKEQATMVKELLSRGMPITAAADHIGIPYMSAWHISKGNTWKNA